MESATIARSAIRCSSGAFASPDLPFLKFDSSRHWIGTAGHRQKYIEDKECDGDVVEERRLRQGWPQLVGGPEQKSTGQKDGFDQFRPRRPAHRLVNQTAQAIIASGNAARKSCAFAGKSPGTISQTRSTPTLTSVTTHRITGSDRRSRARRIDIESPLVKCAIPRRATLSREP